MHSNPAGLNSEIMQHQHPLAGRLYQGSKFRNKISEISVPSDPHLPNMILFQSKFLIFLCEFGNILFKILDRNFQNFGISAPSDTNAENERLNPGLCPYQASV